MSIVRNTSDRTAAPPALRCFLNLGTLGHLPKTSTGPQMDDADLYHVIKAAGFQGVQGDDPRPCHAAGLPFAGGGRVNQPQEADPAARELRDRGAVCGTFHVGWGIEDDDEMDRLVDAVIEASVRHDVPMYIETHRSTITEDIWRTVKLVERFPGVRFNGDFSHWYTGHEMVYGDIARKFDFIQPVFDRVRFMHGRIGNPGSMQVDIGDGEGRPHVDHFRTMWTRSMAGFLRDAKPGDYLAFTPELLYPEIHYARTFVGPDGVQREESDRWEQALLLMKIARACFERARALKPE